MKHLTTDQQTGGRPTLTVIRAHPPRAFGAGIVLDPEEVDRRPVPSSTTGAWNRAGEHDQATSDVAWLREFAGNLAESLRAEMREQGEKMADFIRPRLARAERLAATGALSRRAKWASEAAHYAEILARTEAELATAPGSAATTIEGAPAVTDADAGAGMWADAKRETYSGRWALRFYLYRGAKTIAELRVVPGAVDELAPGINALWELVLAMAPPDRPLTLC